MFYKLWDKECSKESAYVVVAESMVYGLWSMVYGLWSTVYGQQSIVNSL